MSDTCTYVVTPIFSLRLSCMNLYTADEEEGFPHLIPFIFFCCLPFILVGRDRDIPCLLRVLLKGVIGVK